MTGAHYAKRGASTPERLRAMTRVTDEGCWEWIASLDRPGQTRLRVDGVRHPVRRLSYEHFIGPIPVGMTVTQDCSTSLCINPEHLELSTKRIHQAAPLTDGDRRRLLEMRLLKRTQRVGGCLLWRGRLTYAGYGHISVDNDNLNAHRVAYELWVGPIPAGLEIDHLCNVRNCIEPTHLEPVTHSENLRRRYQRAAEVS